MGKTAKKGPTKSITPNNIKIMTIGGATQDIFIKYEDASTMHLHTKKEKQSYLLLQEGAKIEVTDILYSSGGGANNAAFSFKKQGFEVAPFFKIGSDDAGKFIMQDLEKASINSERIVQNNSVSTGISFIIPSLERDRTIFAFRGSNATVTEEELPLDNIKEYAYLYVTSLSGESSKLLPTITSMAKKHNVLVATNPGSSQLIAGADILRASLPELDILILNSAEAKVLMGSLLLADKSLHSSLRKIPAKKEKGLPKLLQNGKTDSFNLKLFLRTVLSYGTNIIAVTNGSEGVYVATKDILYFHPSLPADVVNTLGAGDAFGSAFVGALASKKTVEEALRYGLINATSVIGHTNTHDGLLGLQELEEKAEAIDKDLLQSLRWSS
jgi:sugar/nucleoside kinase (ribokinase family)